MGTISAADVMAGFIPAIHVFYVTGKQDVDARDKPGHDGDNSGHTPLNVIASQRVARMRLSPHPPASSPDELK
jgi:hypothetical protein